MSVYGSGLVIPRNCIWYVSMHPNNGKSWIPNIFFGFHWPIPKVRIGIGGLEGKDAGSPYLNMLWSIQTISAHPEVSLTYFSKRRPFKKVLYVADYKCFQVPINMKLKFEFCTEFFMAGITSCSFATLLHKQSRFSDDYFQFFVQ